MQLCEFGNDKFVVLKMLYDRQMPYKKQKYASLTQQELADLCHFSKSKCVAIVKWLIENNFVIHYLDMKNKYQITDAGLSVIKMMKKEF